MHFYKKYKDTYGISFDNIDVVEMVMPIFGLKRAILTML